MGIYEVNGMESLKELVFVNYNKLIILYSYNDNLSICKNIRQNLKQIHKQYYDNDNLCFLCIDITLEANKEIVDLFKMVEVPQFIIIRKGFILQKLTGEELQRFLATLDECASIVYSPNQEKNDNDNIGDTDYDSDQSSTASDSSLLDKLQDSDDDYNIDIGHDKKLARLVEAAPVMLFIKGSPSNPRCGFSRQMVDILRENQISFGFFDILRDDNIRKLMKKFSDWPTFPQLYINGEFQGGLDIIKEAVEQNPDFFVNLI